MPEAIKINSAQYITELTLQLTNSKGLGGIGLGGTVNLSGFQNLTGITASDNGITQLTNVSGAPLVQTLRFDNNNLTKQNLENIVTDIYSNRNSITGSTNKNVNFNLTGASMGKIDRPLRLTGVNKYEAELDKLNFDVFYAVNGETDQTWNGAGADNNLSTAANWINGLSPLEYDALYFSGATRTNITNDLPADTQLNGVIFNSSAGAYNLSGNRFVLTFDGIGNNSNSTQTIWNDILLSGTNRSVNCNGGQINLNGNIDGSSSLTKNGTGALVLSGSNTFTGGLNVRAGTVLLRNNSSPAGLGLVTIGSIGNSATIDLIGGNRPINSIATSGIAANQKITNTSTTANGTISITGAGTTSVFNGTIENSAGIRTVGLTLNASGATLVLSGTNTYTNNTTVQLGELVIASTGAIPSGSPINVAGGYLSTSLPSVTLNNPGLLNATWNLGSTTNTGNFVFNGTLTPNTTSRGINLGGGITATFNGTVVDVAGASQTQMIFGANAGGGTFILNSANTFEGGASLGTGIKITIGNTGAFGMGTLQLNGTNVSNSTILQASTDLTLTNNWNIGGVNTSPAFATISGQNNITLTGTYLGGDATKTLISSLDSGKVLTINGPIGINSAGNNRTFTIAGTGNTIINGNITNNAAGGTSPSGRLTIANTALTVLNGTGSYGGPTSITAGTLRTTKIISGTAGKFQQADFTNTSLIAAFSVAPSIGDFFRLFSGSTAQTYTNISLTNGGGRAGSYNSTNSTLTIS